MEDIDQKIEDDVDQKIEDDEKEDTVAEKGAKEDSSRRRWIIIASIIAAILIVLVVVIVVVILVTKKSDSDSKVTKAYPQELFQELDKEDQELIENSEEISTVTTTDTPITIESKTYTASYPITEGKKVYCLATEEKVFSSANQENNVFVVTDGGQLLLSGKITITKTAESASRLQSNIDVSGATNSALVVSGDNSMASLYGVTIITDAQNAHALVTMLSGRAKLADCTIHTEGDSSRGLYALSSSSITGTGIGITTEGDDSQLVYSAGTVTLETADGTASQSQAIVIEGNSSVTTQSCTFSCYAHGSTKDEDHVVIDNGAVVFFSTAEDGSDCTGTFTDTESTFTIHEVSSYFTVAPFFFVTNTKANIKMEKTKCNFYQFCYFITARGTTWGTASSNGGVVTCELTSVTRTSTLNLKDPISSITDTDSHVSIGLPHYTVNLSDYDTDLVIYRSGLYTLSGTLHHSLFINTDSVALILNGVTIQSQLTAAIVNVRNAELTLHVMPGTTNTFSDYKDATDEYEGCIYSNGHLIIQGSSTGVVNVNGNRKYGIATNAADITISGGAGINIISKNSGLISTGTGGTITVVGGNMYIDSGTTGIVTKKDASFEEGIIYSPGSSIDCTEGYVVAGVTIVALGSGAIENPPKESDQYCLSFTLANEVPLGTLVVLTDEENHPVIAFDARKAFTTLIISHSSLTKATYKLFTGGTMSSSALNHFYPIDSETTYTVGTQIKVGECDTFTITKSTPDVISFDSTCKTKSTDDTEDPGTGDHDNPDTGDDEDPGTGDHDDPGTGDHDDPGTGDHDDPGTGDPSEADSLPLYVVTHPVQSRVGISYSISSTPVTRNIPTEAKNGSLSRYPVYGTVMSTSDLSDEEATKLKEAIIAENKEMISTTNMALSGNLDHYDHMDKDGYFYLNDVQVTDSAGNPLKLYKHTASAGMYYGNVADTDEAIEKTITITPRSSGNYITGLYAPPGEVVKVTISAADLAAIGAVPIYIGQVYANGLALSPGSSADLARMPTHCNRFILDKEEIYVGFHLGGPIYIGSPTKKGSTFSVTISGAVPYPHFILGYTTKEDYEASKAGTAPYFDWEVWDDSVRLSGARSYAEELTWEELYQTATLWDKISRVSNQIPQSGDAGAGIVVNCGPHVACGAACALKGQNTVTLPDGWMPSSLNAADFIRNGGWGNIHELNHHYQSYGLPDGGEVTNNAINILEYSLFTIVGVTRTQDTSTSNSWPRFTDPWYSLRRTLYADTERPIVALSAYMNIFHTFGHTKFIEAAQNCKGSSGAEVYYNAVTDAMHNDFTYYFTKVLFYTEATLSAATKDAAAAKKYPVFVPLACLFQVGRSYYYDGEKQYSNTAHPYRIDFDEPFTFTLEDVLAYPADVTVSLETHTSPEYGSLIHNADETWTYLPDSRHRTSGNFIFTFSVSVDGESFTCEDIDLVLCFDAAPPVTPARTTYYYDSAKYTLVTDAIAADYADYTSSKSWKWTTPALWWNGDGVSLNCLTEYTAKAYVTESKSYRIALRGKQASLHFWNSDKTIDQTITIGDYFCNHYDAHSIPNGYYKDITVTKGDVLYFKVVMLSADTRQCFFEIGASKQASDETYPTPSIISNTFTLYNIDYEPETYESDYFISRSYTAAATTVSPTQQHFVTGINAEPWDDTYSTANMFDGDSSTVYHTKKAIASNPLTIEVELDGTYTVDSMIIKGRSSKPTTPKTYKFYAGTSADDLKLVYTAENQETVGSTSDSVVQFDEPITLSYYKLEVTAATGNYVAISGIYFYLYDGGEEISPDSARLTYRGEWNWVAQHSPYGHVYTSSKGTIEFSFTGTMVAIITAADENEQQFTVSIDGGEAESVTVAAGQTGTAFAKKLEEDKEHTVLISTESNIKVASFITM